MTKYEKFDYEKIRESLKGMREEITTIEEWVYSHTEVEVRAARRGLLEQLWAAKDNLVLALHEIHVYMLDDES